MVSSLVEQEMQALVCLDPFSSMPEKSVDLAMPVLDRQSRNDLATRLVQIEDRKLREVVKYMIQQNPRSRLTASKALSLSAFDEFHVDEGDDSPCWLPGVRLLKKCLSSGCIR